MTGYTEKVQLITEYREKAKALGLSDDFDQGYFDEKGNHLSFRLGELEKSELENMRSNIIGRFYCYIDLVKNGIPLEGTCNSCPLKHLSIKE
jgi:hypothetical protein